MRRRFLQLAVGGLLAGALPARADTDRLDGVVPLAADDITALARARTERRDHVLLYFGDHLN